jgi:hypothetical protein
MKKLLRTVVTVAAATVVSGTLIAGLSGTASAYGTAPPWESTITPTPEVGGLTFYNSSGQVITGGSTSSGPVAAYIQGSSVIRTNDNLAVLNAYTPVNGNPAGSWSGEGVSGTTTFPHAGAPASLASSDLPLVTGSTGDYSLANYVGDYPNGDTSSDGYAGLYVLRLFTSQTGHGTSTNYDEAVISISGTTWTLDYTPATATTTTLATSPASPQLQGTSVQLTATVTSGAPGTVTFENGGVPITGATNVAVTSGSASTTVTGLPVGSNSLTAVFTPTTGSAFAGSSSAASTYTINAPTPTSTTLVASPASPQSVGTPEDLTATETPAVAGSVQFFDGTTSLGTQAVAGGTATLGSVTSLPVGTDPLTAVFTPTSNAYASSTSSAVDFVVQPLGDVTVTALSVNPSIAPVVGSTVTITADVSDPTNPSPSPSGTVQLTDNGSNLGSPVALVGGVATDPVTSGLSVGANDLVAVYTPTTGSTSWKPSASIGVVFTGQDANGSTGPDAQTLQVGIPAGALTITTPYGPSNPFNLGNAVLDPAGASFSASAPFGNPGTTSSPTANGGVSITDTEAGDAAWTASAQVTNFSNGGSGVINGQNLAFLGVAPAYIAGNALQTGSVVTSNVASVAVSNDTPYSPTGGPGTDGLYGAPHAFATAAAGDGSVYVDGTLSLVAPTSTPAGTYTATLTFTIV